MNSVEVTMTTEFPVFDLDGWKRGKYLGGSSLMRSYLHSRDEQFIVVGHIDRDQLPTYSKANMLVHPGIVRCLGQCDDGIVYEYVPGTDLHASNKLKFSWNAVKNVLLAIADILEFVHSKGFGHYNLSSDNVIFTEDWQVKLCTFTVPIEPERSNMTTTDNDLWVAPEVALGGKHNPQADMFSFGLIVAFLMTKKSPPRRSPIKDFAANPATIERSLLAGFPDELWELAKDCMEFDASSRPTPSQAKDRLTSMVFEGEPKPVLVE